MKHIFLFIISVLLTASVAHAQSSNKVLEAEVPSAVTKTFVDKIKLPKSTAVVWELDENDKEYCAVYFEDGLRVGVYIQADGQFMRTYANIKQSDIPTSITSYIETKQPKANIRSAYVRTSSDGYKFYKIYVEEEKSGGEIRNTFVQKRSYEFDAKGNLILINH